MTRVIRVLKEAEVTPESFHDCHVFGLRWERPFTFSVDIHYILEWLLPRDSSLGYRFSIAEGAVTFHSVDDLEIKMAWAGSSFDSQIGSLTMVRTRTTPNGATQRYFEIEFSDPDGTISFWSTGYEVLLFKEPVLSEATSIRSS